MPIFVHAEVEINSVCDCDCWGCDRFIPECPTTHMTVEQIDHFIDECLSLDWEWKRIRILGGEPTLHPQFDDVLNSFHRYKVKNSECVIRVTTNGRGKLERYREKILEKNFEIRNTIKQPGGVTPKWFRNIRQAPIDIDKSLTRVEHCTIFSKEGLGCGLGITKHGIFMCGAGASIARVIGADIGLQSMRHVNYRRLAAQSTILCHICGHWSKKDSVIKEVPMVSDTGKTYSPFWKEVLRNWKEKPMTLYGVNNK